MFLLSSLFTSRIFHSITISIFLFLSFSLIAAENKRNYTIVTAFFDIKRENWPSGYKRNVNVYLENGKRMLSLDDPMIIFVDSKYADFVKEHRKKFEDKTIIIPMEIEDLPYYKYKERIATIMADPSFKNGLCCTDVPEVCEPLYDIVIWSKLPLVAKAVEMNPYHTSHFVWLDFGIHRHMLHENMLGKPLFANTKVDDKIRICCRSLPSKSDLNIEQFYKSHTNRIAATLFSGNGENLRLFNQYQDEEIRECLNKNLVDCEQSIYAVIYLKHPELFDLYLGDWCDIVTHYNK